MAVDIEALRGVLKEMQELRDRWCAEEIDDAEEMWVDIPEFLSRAVPAMEAAIGDAFSVPPLEIIEAKYGANDTYINVTEKLISQGFVAYDKVKIKIDNTVFGDPVFGCIKELIVLYKLGGEERAIRAKEGDTLVIGGKP